MMFLILSGVQRVKIVGTLLEKGFVKIKLKVSLGKTILHLSQLYVLKLEEYITAKEKLQKSWVRIINGQVIYQELADMV